MVKIHNNLTRADASREGFESTVSRPEVIMKRRLMIQPEPIEVVVMFLQNILVLLFLPLNGT